MKEKQLDYYSAVLTEESVKKLMNYLSAYGSIIMNGLDKLYLDHVTLLHSTQIDTPKGKYIQETLDIWLQETTECQYFISHIGISDKAVAFKLAACFGYNDIPHITIGTFKGGKPVDSNNITTWIPLSDLIPVDTVLTKIER